MDHARTLLNNLCLRKYGRVLKDRNCKVFLVPAEFMLVKIMPVDLTTFVSSLLFPFFGIVNTVFPRIQPGSRIEPDLELNLG